MDTKIISKPMNQADLQSFGGEIIASKLKSVARVLGYSSKKSEIKLIVSLGVLLVVLTSISFSNNKRVEIYVLVALLQIVLSLLALYIFEAYYYNLPTKITNNLQICIALIKSKGLGKNSPLLYFSTGYLGKLARSYSLAKGLRNRHHLYFISLSNEWEGDFDSLIRLSKVI